MRPKTRAVKLLTLATIAGCASVPWSGDSNAMEVRVVDEPPVDRANDFYVMNRAPLLPSPFAKLPVGSIEPRGWLLAQLELEADGMTGHLYEWSKWCVVEGHSWLSPDGVGHSPWEEMPYWLKGYGDLAYILDRPDMIERAKFWIEGALSTVRPDGYFGPQANRDNHDVWPNMIMLNVLQSYYEWSGDERVIDLMSGYFRWQLQEPIDYVLPGSWQKIRAGDNLESILWLYNRTGDSYLLDLAHRIHERTSDWTLGVSSWHGVNITQCFRQPAVYYMLSGNGRHLNATHRDYDIVMASYGQVPGGMFGADENCRQGYSGPRQGAETCSIVEFMHSFEMLTKITGDPLWADRCEEVAFNSMPASMTADLKGLHYLTAPNMVQLDGENKSPDLQNSGSMLLYSPYARYRCCQHNVSHGWPYYAEELWLATPDNGLCASLYSASAVTAKVGGGVDVTIEERTDYPFGDVIEFSVAAPKAVAFPLYLRVPRWCSDARVSVNGESVSVDARSLSYIVIDRTWSSGDTVALRLPMVVSVRTWEANFDSVSVDRGPLTYSLLIGERSQKSGGSDEWPELEVFPTTPWNYGLVLDPIDPASSFEVVEKPGPLPYQPFEPGAAPIQLRAKARKIPQWQLEQNGLVGEIQQSPALTSEPAEEVTLIPMGAARLRISAFPTVTTGREGHEWVAPVIPPPPHPCSHCFDCDSTRALDDGILPKASSDASMPRFSWWDHKGTVEWVGYDWEAPRAISWTEVYWWDDTNGGGCRIPASWRLLYKRGDEWVEVTGASAYGVEVDKFNRVTFDKVKTDGVRIEVQLQEGLSGGILEWRIGN